MSSRRASLSIPHGSSLGNNSSNSISSSPKSSRSNSFRALEEDNSGLEDNQKKNHGKHASMSTKQSHKKNKNAKTSTDDASSENEVEEWDPYSDNAELSGDENQQQYHSSKPANYDASQPAKPTESENPDTATEILGALVKDHEESIHRLSADKNTDFKSLDDDDEEGLDESFSDIQQTLSFLADHSKSNSAQAPTSSTSDVDSEQSSGIQSRPTGTTTAGGGGYKSADEFMMMRVKSEYEKLHKMFIQSRRNEQALVKKCRDMTAEMTANSAKVQAALKLSQNDRATISTLQKEVQKAWKMVETGTEKDKRAKEAIARLKVELDNLKSSKNTSSSSSADDETVMDRKDGLDNGADNSSNQKSGGGGIGGGYSKLMEANVIQEEKINQLIKVKKKKK